MPPRRTRPALLLLAVLWACAPGASAPPPVPASGTPDAGTGVDAFDLPELPAAQPISPEEYARRRAALVAGLEEGTLLVLGSPEPEADYLPFAQNPGFRYLTGITEPGAALLVEKRDGGVRERLFVRPRNPAREVWEGPRLGAEGAEARTGIPARGIDQLVPALEAALARTPRLYTVAEVDEEDGPLEPLSPTEQLVRELRRRHADLEVIPVSEQLAQLRGTKSREELDRLRRAVYITTLAHRAAMRTIEPGMNEFEIQALIEYMFRRHGAERPAFASIVGSGPNATTLHYNADDRFMQPGELVVMDIGALYRGYAADVTRTVPVSGRFSPEQRAVYEIVLAAQKAAEAAARPGATWAQLNEAAERVLAEGLARLGLIESPGATYDCRRGDEVRQCPQYRLFYLHGLGHGIGLEVHDPDASYFGAFRVGSAFTIEPGIYVRADALEHLPSTPTNRALVERLRPAVQRYRNIGVRIEDDYLVTPQGVERISAGAPREVGEIEALMRLPGVAEAERRPEVVEWYRATTPR